MLTTDEMESFMQRIAKIQEFADRDAKLQMEYKAKLEVANQQKDKLLEEIKDAGYTPEEIGNVIDSRKKELEEKISKMEDIIANVQREDKED